MKRSLKITASLGGIVAALGLIWSVTSSVVALAAQVNHNTDSVQAIVQSLELSRISDTLGDLKKDRRDLKKELRADPDSPDIEADIDEIEDSIDDAIMMKECILDPTKMICE